MGRPLCQGPVFFQLIRAHPGSVLVVVGDLLGIAEGGFRGVVALRWEWAEEPRGGIPMTCGIGSTSARNGGKSAIQVGFGGSTSQAFINR